jgi:hypothetical protein
LPFFCSIAGCASGGGARREARPGGTVVPRGAAALATSAAPCPDPGVFHFFSSFHTKMFIKKNLPEFFLDVQFFSFNFSVYFIHFSFVKFLS